MKQKIDQIVLLKDVIHIIKCKFNKKFNEMYEEKKDKMTKTKEMNQRIEEINKELEIDDKVWTPEWKSDENPQFLFEVEPEELSSKRMQSVVEHNEKKQSEDIMDETFQEKIWREKILYKSLYGLVETKIDQQLKRTPEPSEFISNKKVENFTQEELEVKEFQNTFDRLQSLEMYKHHLESEKQRLKDSIQKITTSFDEELNELKKQKLFTVNVIYQEEFLICNLLLSIVTENELMKWDCYIKHKIEENQREQQNTKFLIRKAENLEKIISEKLQMCQHQDKTVESCAKKELKTLYHGELYTYYKKKPKNIHKSNLISKSGNPYYEPDSKQFFLSISEHSTVSSALEETRPDFISLENWEKMCHLRQQKFKAELEVQEQMHAYTDIIQYTKKQQQKLTKFQEKSHKMYTERNRVLGLIDNIRNNVQIQLILPYGNVEVEGVDVLPDLSKANLLHVTVIDKLNKEIKNLGEIKINSIIKSAGILENVDLLQTKRNKLETEVDRLDKYLKNVDHFTLTRIIRRFLMGEKIDSINVKKEKVIQLTNMKEKLHEKQCKQCRDTCDKINQDIKKLQNHNDQLQKQIDILYREVTEMELIYENNSEY
ncbi:cilia- and flagella-associated protein 43-like [Centruroides sculpturatus]|uniref:cilia- and flagella-associated protein 43-like n=1 Tax=Centruroides sculpturatus TaxID=218467 RepID=UPI000C6C9C6F|nr:cilia- and flagella-associated protein 43-like [Centruroides sculpturatus]